jgi:hypothetical protein
MVPEHCSGLAVAVMRFCLMDFAIAVLYAVRIYGQDCTRSSSDLIINLDPKRYVCLPVHRGCNFYVSETRVESWQDRRMADENAVNTI